LGLHGWRESCSTQVSTGMHLALPPLWWSFKSYFPSFFVWVFSIALRCCEGKVARTTTVFVFASRLVSFCKCMVCRGAGQPVQIFQRHHFASHLKRMAVVARTEDSFIALVKVSHIIELTLVSLLHFLMAAHTLMRVTVIQGITPTRIGWTEVCRS
jgi:hypothetical protein